MSDTFGLNIQLFKYNQQKVVWEKLLLTYMFAKYMDEISTPDLYLVNLFSSTKNHKIEEVSFMFLKQMEIVE